jgi:pyrophosphate--fructose-6-phosphate 1-phosphotransferase
MRDANSARKYWHFVKLMGRSASHIALECALQTHPNACLISEEVQAKGQTLAGIVADLAATVKARAKAGLNFGIVLVPEGLIEFIPSLGVLIGELNDLLAEGSATAAAFAKLAGLAEQIPFAAARLTPAAAETFAGLPDTLKGQLMADRDPHGNVQVSKIETEKLLADMVGAVLKKDAEYKQAGGKFSPQTHFFGYEGRCAAPSNFDADYCYRLGYTAATLIGAGRTAYMASVRNVAAPASHWEAGGTPLTMMMNMERRHGHDRPVIRKALVELDGKPFQAFAAERARWAVETDYVYPGPIQYFGPTEVCDQANLTLVIERG